MAAGDVNVKITTPRAFKGASFDGVDDYVEIPHHASQLGANLSNGFTISAWVFAKSKGEATGRIIDKSSGDGGTNGFEFGMSSTTSKLAFVLNNGTAATGATPYSYKSWKHVLVTVSSGQLCNFYINNVQNGTANQNLVQTISTITTTNNIRLGNITIDTSATFDGLIKDVKMWNRVLTADEIAKDYAGINISDGQILNVPLQDDYNDKSPTALTGTNSGTSFVTQEDTFRNVLSGQLIISQLSGSYILSGQYMICGLAGGQICSVALQHT